MDNVILDVVLGLVLIYLVMALLVTKLQEVLVGQLFSDRTRNLHKMLDEATGNDPTLKAQVLANPLIFALSRGDQPSRTGLRPKGPSAIPPDLFARTVLVELYHDRGNHPSTRFTPSQFVTQMGAGQPGRIWGTLRSLVSGHEANWTSFEQALADWYKAIGDRADGWYQRSAQSWSLVIALALALILNADSFRLAERLANEPDLRRSLSTLAQNLNASLQQEAAQEQGDAARKAAAQATQAALAPDRRAEQALNQAAALLTATYFRHQDVATFDPNVASIGEGTKEGLTQRCASAQTNSKELLSGTRDAKSHVFLSNPITWLYLMQSLQTQIKIFRRPMDSGETSDKASLKRSVNPTQIHDCIANLSGWVALASQRPGKDSAAQDSLREASTQLSRAADAMLEVLQDQGAPTSFKALFLLDPDTFLRCNEEANISRDGLRQCVLAGQNGRVNLPLGWTQVNRRQGFCHIEQPKKLLPTTTTVRAEATSASGATVSTVTTVTASTPELETGASGWMADFLCGAERGFDGNPALRLSPMRIVGPSGWEFLFFLIGAFITALFVALGAPFWFDLLGRVVKLRAAGGKAREDALSTPDGGGGSGSSARGTGGQGGPGGASGSDGTAPFSEARNELERILPVGDLIALQGALGVERTGRWDAMTRQSMALKSQQLGLGGSDELSNQLYAALMGQSLSGLKVFQPPTSRLVLRAPDARAGTVAAQLMKLLDFEGRVPTTLTTVTDDVRALAVLWRYKQQASLPVHERPIVNDARIKHRLDDITPAEMAAIQAQASASPLVKLPRETPSWLDWALGELGQAEACEPAAGSRDMSNPRILEYLKAGGAPNASESTAWCAAFASWVLQRGQVPNAPAQVSSQFFGGPHCTFATRIWTEGMPWNPTQIQAGDIVTLDEKRDGKGIHHVGFVLTAHPEGVWAISGNWGNQVKIDLFKLATLVDVRRV